MSYPRLVVTLLRRVGKTKSKNQGTQKSKDGNTQQKNRRADHNYAQLTKERQSMIMQSQPIK